MATIGNTTASASGERKIFQVYKGIAVTMPENGTAVSMKIRCKNTVTPGVWQAGIWSAAGAVIDSSATRSDIGVAAEYTFTGFTASLVAATAYFFGVGADGVADDLGDSVDFNAAETYDGRSASGDADNVDPLATATFGADSTRDYCIELTYTVGGGSPAVSKTIRRTMMGVG